MNSKYQNIGNLVPIKIEPITKKQAVAIKSNFDEDTTQKIIYSNGKTTTTSRYSRIHARVKQETLQETGPKIKLENNTDNSLRNNQVTVKMEVEDIQPSIIQHKEPSQTCKIEDVKMIYKCCNRTFNDKFLHFYHMLNHMEEELTSVKCYYCNSLFKSNFAMKSHAQAKHTGFRCMNCSTLSFPSKHMLLQHLEIYHNYVPRKRQNLNHANHMRWQRQMWENEYRYGNEFDRSKYKLNRNTEASSKFKVDRRSTDVKSEPKWNAKFEPTFSNAKPEPIFCNVKTEPTFTNIKTEPSFTNINTGPTLKIKTEPAFNIKVEPRIN